MKKEIYVNPTFSYLTDFIKQTPDNFDYMGKEIHNKRNEVRVVSEKGLLLTIKYFKRITFANRIIYATIRKSKARRAYEHSRLLLRKGITSPEPVAWVNCYKHGILYKSYYVSLYTSYKPLNELLELPTGESEEALKAFARFTYRLHRNGILHDDFTVNNVLYTQIDNEYDFSLIDNNRMRFLHYSYGRGVRNLERLKIPVEKMGIIAAEYAHEAHVSDLRMLNAMTFYQIRYIIKLSIKKWFKSIVTLISGKHHISPIEKSLEKIHVKMMAKQ